MSKLNRLMDLTSQALGTTPSPPAAGAGGSEKVPWQAALQQAAGALTRKDAPPRTPLPVPGTPAEPPTGRSAQGRRSPLTPPPAVGPASDRDAVARYEYLLRTAPPAQLEQIHHDAFARLGPGDREQVAERMRAELPPGEQPRSAGPADLARAATRAEIGRPGSLAPLLARSAPVLAGTAAAGGLLIAIAGGAVVSTVAAPLLAQALTAGVDFSALAESVDLEAITGVGGELTAGAMETVSSASDTVTGLADQVSSLGDSFSGIGLPGLGDLFGR
ncbi:MULTISPECIES: cation-transporting ATPase [Microbacterium]|uniref:cation-transporting ATPase n=1 Tax=Microbacterium TaxID=33882 RepID=UPI001469FED8|nr:MULTISPECIES: cation-transporting ATPase [Microbacterium]